MSEALNGITAGLLIVGVAFFCAGSVGLLRFPNVHSRLHALSKADNIGLGFICMGLVLQAESLAVALKIVVIWVLALLGSGLMCFLIAGWEMAHGRSSRNL